ncbi:MAG TPA: zinc metallochaperone AztD [Devosia sp.]|jgi:hypothetical protein|uniref:zinc metallochaperone AztD n=1 Tax=Devosia sp. TaxID=1871048 RepID=UPI002DDD1316|nr:zinc metallochaperone AztD [Devosia sp.]HEV2516107.1 zinc metallochaperone AztD [Devosia sp.]
MQRPLLIGLTLALMTSAAPSLAEEASAWRLFVADHSDPLVTALDVESGKTIGQFQLKGPATLYATPSKGGVYAVQTESNQVTAIATGIAIEDHGDHGDLKLGDPALIDVALEGERPVHFVPHDGHLAIFFDGTGTAKLVHEDDWLEGEIEGHDFHTAAPHHGVAVQVGDHLVISEPNAADPSALPVGVRVLDHDGKVVGALHDCPDLHGEASSGDTLAIACAAGLLLVKQAAAGPSIELLPYSADLPEGKSTTLLGGVGLQYFLGNYGADKVVIVEPGAEAAFRLVNLPTRRVHFAVDPQRVRFAYVFTEDGNLHELDVVDGAITRSLKLTEPYSMDGEWSLPRPRIAVAGGDIAVTDPLKGLIHIVHAEDFELESDIALDGKPFNIVAVGGSGEDHGHHHHH